MISFHGDEGSLCNGLIILNIRVENASCFGGEHFLFSGDSAFVDSADFQSVLISYLQYVIIIFKVYSHGLQICDIGLFTIYNYNILKHIVTDCKSATSGFFSLL